MSLEKKPMPTLSELADELEHRMSEELEAAVPIRSPIYRSGERDPRADDNEMDAVVARGRKLLMGPDPRLPPMPERPTLEDFFRLRLGNTQHMLHCKARALRGSTGMTRRWCSPACCTISA